MECVEIETCKDGGANCHVQFFEVRVCATWSGVASVVGLGGDRGRGG